jgi:hypothetical protein
MNTRQTGHAQERPAAVRVSDVNRRMMLAIERFIVGYTGDDLLQRHRAYVSDRELPSIFPSLLPRARSAAPDRCGGQP